MSPSIPAHEEILRAVQRLCARREKPVFTPDEVVRALPHVNAQTVRTHVTSRCTVNARPHHQSRLRYFRRVGRGRYELLAEHRRPRTRTAVASARRDTGAPPLGDTIHGVITRDGGTYVVDCHEVAVVTQARSLDEALANLMEALRLHLEGEDLRAFGLGDLKRVQVSYDLPVDVTAA